MTYIPDADFSGSDSFNYTISDDNGGNATATVNVTVNAVNDAPVAVDDAVITDEDTALTISVLSNDSDLDGDTLGIIGVTDGSNGTVAISGTDVVYTPDADFNGTDSFTYTISDGNGVGSTATVTVTVNPVNDAPVVNAGSDQTVNEGEVFNFNGSYTDVDTNDTHTALIDWGDGTGVEAVSVDSLAKELSGSHVYADNGTYTVVVTITDSEGVSSSDSLTVTVNNVAPTVTSDAAEVIIDRGATASNTGTLGDVGNDTIILSASVGIVIDNGDGTWSWSYDSSDATNDSQTVTIIATDSDGASTTASFELVVNDGDNPEVEGDLDGDGDVDGDDYTLFAGALFTSEGQAGYLAEADYDGDSMITYNDYGIWYGYYYAYNMP